MNAREVELLAVNRRGTLYAAASHGSIAVVEGSALRELATVPPRAGVAVALSSLAVFGDELLASDPRARRVVCIDDVAVRPYEAATGAIKILAPSGERLYLVDATGAPPYEIRFVQAGQLRTLPIRLPDPAPLGAAAGTGDGGLFVATKSGLALFHISPSGACDLVAGSIHEAGTSDGPGATARFARITSVAPARAGGCAVVDGVRLRMVTAVGEVTTMAGGAPGFADGPRTAGRFGGIRAIAVLPDGSVVVSDRVKGCLRTVTADGVVATLAEATCSTSGPMTDDDARMLAQEFAQAVVSGDDRTAAAAVDRFLDAFERSGAIAPERSRFPISAASARVGRELALRWCLGGTDRLARVGAFCLWLVRAAEGDDAPRSDAERLATELERALAAGDAARAARVCDCVEVAFGRLRLPRDREQVASAICEGNVDAHALGLARSNGPTAGRVAARVLGFSSDPRVTPELLALATDDTASGPRAAALAALVDIWGSAEPPVVDAGLVESLRFARHGLVRILDTCGPSLGQPAAGRLHALLDRLS